MQHIISLVMVFSLLNANILNAAQKVRTIGAHVVDDVNGFPAMNVKVNASQKIGDDFVAVGCTYVIIIVVLLIDVGSAPVRVPKQSVHFLIFESARVAYYS